MQQRRRRIAEEIRKIVSVSIRENVKDPRINELVSVISVEISKDMRYAKIYISVLGNEIDKQNVMYGLENASGFIRKEIATQLKIRFVPEISFKLDSSIEHSVKIASILNSLNNQKKVETDDIG